MDVLASVGGVGGMVGRYLEKKLHALIEKGGDLTHCRKVLEAMCRSSGEKQAQSLNDIAAYSGVPLETLPMLLDALVGHRLVRRLGAEQYEIQHDRLALTIQEGMNESDRDAKLAAEMLASRAASFPRTHTVIAQADLLFMYRHLSDRQLRPTENVVVLATILDRSDEIESVLGWRWLVKVDLLPLLRELAREDRNVRRAAVAEIGKYQHAEDLPLLRELAHDANWNVRLAAVAEIGKYQQAEDLPLLRELARDANRAVRRAAMAALTKLQSREELEQWLNSEAMTLSFEALSVLDNFLYCPQQFMEADENEDEE